MSDSTLSDSSVERTDIAVLTTTVFVVSVCAIVYELLISSLSSYYLGSSILHFSLTIGLFMFFMGVGSFFSKFLTENLLDQFVRVELLIGIVGGVSALLLQAGFAATEFYYVIYLVLIAAISTLIGLEIPIITRILERKTTLKDALANILAFDYLGALVASILFPLVLVPYIGLMRTACVVGVLNVAIALVCVRHFRERIKTPRRYGLFGVLSIAGLVVCFVYSLKITTFFEQVAYQDKIIYSEQTPYQRVVITQFKNDTRLYLDGNLQFSSIDEHRYHEPLVHVPMAAASNREEVLLLGAGDGLALREILRYEDVKRVTVVDIDPAIVSLGKNFQPLVRLNNHAFSDSRVRVVHEDAFSYLEKAENMFSVIIADLPDPNNLTLGKLYSLEFYKMLSRRLGVGGVFVTQASSPYFARIPFWSIHNTLQEAFSYVVPMNNYVPSFGQWGFHIGSNQPVDVASLKLKHEGDYLSAEVLPTLFLFDGDTSEQPAEVNRLNNQILVQLYEQSWEHYH